MIDFDDGGFGFRLFDIATALIKHRVEPDFTDLRAALIEGYHSQRTLDVGALEFFHGSAGGDLCWLDHHAHGRGWCACAQ